MKMSERLANGLAFLDNGKRWGRDFFVKPRRSSFKKSFNALKPEDAECCCIIGSMLIFATEEEKDLFFQPSIESYPFGKGPIGDAYNLLSTCLPVQANQSVYEFNDHTAKTFDDVREVFLCAIRKAEETEKEEKDSG